MKTVRHCSIDVLESKNYFGMSASPGEKIRNGCVARFPKFSVVLISFWSIALKLF